MGFIKWGIKLWSRFASRSTESWWTGTIFGRFGCVKDDFGKFDFFLSEFVKNSWCEAFASIFPPGGPFGQNQGSSCDAFFSSSSRFSHGLKGLQKQNSNITKVSIHEEFDFFNDFSRGPREMPTRDWFWTDLAPFWNELLKYRPDSIGTDQKLLF